METTSPPQIEHLVISGGGINGFAYYGVLRASHNDGFWDIKNIKSIYATSVGAIFGTVMSFLPLFDWDTIDNYVINRPWNQLFHFHLDGIIQSIQNRGIFDRSVIERMFLPFLEAISYKTEQPVGLDVTLAEWFDLTHIDLCFVTTELTQFQLNVISHKTRPSWRLIDAVYASCALPVLFQPLEMDGKLYMDGGLLNNYPAELCVQGGVDPDTVFGVAMDVKLDTTSHLETLVDYILYILNQMLSHILDKPPPLKNQVNVLSPPISLVNVYKGTHSIDERKRLVDHGRECWIEFTLSK